MNPPTNSRKGKRIARAACDMCRERKVQCVFFTAYLRCTRCERADIPCTFMTERKPRGPSSRLIEQARNGKLDRNPTSPSGPQPPPMPGVTLEQFCSNAVFSQILEDFFSLVYSVLPLVHPPTFRALVAKGEQAMSQPFLRQCLAVAAITVASLPRKLNSYDQENAYPSVSSMVAHAIRLVQLSRATEDPHFISNPNLEHVTTSLMLSMAAHYSGHTNHGWAFASEAMLFIRDMGLGERRGYENVPIIESELRKRAFWCGYIIQIHDRISSIAPHTGLSYLPRQTEWDLIIPLAVHDEDLVAQRQPEELRNEHPAPQDTPFIVGFVALIQVFRCCADLFSFGLPGSVNQAYSMVAGPIDSQLLPSSPESTSSFPALNSPSKGLAAIFQVFQSLNAIMDTLPPELNISSGRPSRASSKEHLIDPFDIMRANIHITSLYLQSTILETFASRTRSAAALSSTDISDEAMRVKTQIWDFRESIARELLQVVESCPLWTLEANGASMIIKVREIASTLLDEADGDDLRLDDDEEESSQAYVKKFVEILSNLDFGARRGEGAGLVTGA